MPQIKFRGGPALLPEACHLVEAQANRVARQTIGHGCGREINKRNKGTRAGAAGAAARPLLIAACSPLLRVFKFDNPKNPIR
jgi:hypothetical protein